MSSTGSRRGIEAVGPIAVLGGTGLTGRHVIRALVDAGRSDIIASHRSRPAFQERGVQWRQTDLLRPKEVAEALDGARTVVLSAGTLSTTAQLRRDPTSSILDTLRIGVNVLEAAATRRVERFVLLSSCTGYPEGSSEHGEAHMFEGDPPFAWFGVGWMHRYLEKQLEWYSTYLGMMGSAVALRPTLIYGPHDDFKPESGHFVPLFIHRVVSRERPIEVWGDGNQTRNLIHAADVASAVVAALRPGTACRAYNVAASDDVSVNEVLRVLIELDGFDDAQIVHRPDKSAGPSALKVSAAAFSREFAWQPTMSLREGLADTLEWYRRANP